MMDSLTVTDLKIANYMINQGCRMNGLEETVHSLSDAKMIFCGEGIYEAYGYAVSHEVPELSSDETNRIVSMVTLLSLVKEEEENAV